MNDAIILCSGGIDSSTLTFYVKKRLKYKNIKILFFNYGQKSLNSERKAAKFCASRINAKFKEILLPELANLSNSLINVKKKPKGFKKSISDTKEESKIWYVSGRNTLFITYALSEAESIFIRRKIISDIFIGFKCEGDESYPDTTQEYVDEMNKVSKIAFIKPFKVLAPLIKMDKEDIILLSKKLSLNHKYTFSCYISNHVHCGLCLACKLRKAGFYWANIQDPTKYKI